MTTLAYKDGILAADSQVTCGAMRDSTMVKIVRNQLGDLCGAAGNAAFMWALQKWFTNGEKGDPPTPSENDAGVVIRASGVIECYEHPGPSPFEVKAPLYAIGSGRQVALGAMAFGASAEEAIKIASQFDIYTSGEVVTLTHRV